MHCTAAGFGSSAITCDDGVGMTDPGQAPGADQALVLQLFHRIAHMRTIERQRRQSADIRRVPHRMSVGCDVGVQEENIQLVALQQPQAGFDRLAEDRQHFFRRRIAQVALAGDVDAGRHPAAERLSDHPFRLAVAIAGGEVEQIDPGLHRVMHGGETFFERRLAPQHAKAAAAQGECRDGKQRAEWMQFHGLGPPSSFSDPLAGSSKPVQGPLMQSIRSDL